MIRFFDGLKQSWLQHDVAAQCVFFHRELVNVIRYMELVSRDYLTYGQLMHTVGTGLTRHATSRGVDNYF